MIRWITAGLGFLVCLPAETFFSLAPFFGFENSEGSPGGFPAYAVSLSLLSLVLYSFSLFRESYISRVEAYIFLFILFLLLTHFFNFVATYPETSLLPYNLVLFGSLTVPAFFMARATYVLNAERQLEVFAGLVSVAMALGLFSEILLPFLQGDFVKGIAGASYQAASYYAALLFGLLGIIIYRLESSSILILSFLRLFILSLMFAMLVVALVNGGRGAFVLLVIYALTFTFLLVKLQLQRLKSKLPLLFYGLVGSILSLYSFRYFGSSEIFMSSFLRATSFLRAGDQGLGIGVVGARTRLYPEVIEAIKDAPLAGYGSFAHWERTVPPHNFFFDLSLQFGLPLAAFLVLFFGGALIIALRNRAFSPLVMVLLTYQVVYLSFSGGYLRSGAIWFVITLIFMKSFAGTKSPPSVNKASRPTIVVQSV